ncbi:MAG TPA: hypothetical protein VN578_17125 [Candidatus Binatia bacterium]|jgi:hypothetical protein|nr:hypothetical protein [Candidatus Binatia bacterium]
MQIPKPLLVVCAAAWAICVHGADSEGQAKARQALEKKLNELQTPWPESSTPAVTPRPAAEVRSDSDAIARAREAVRQKIQEDRPESRPIPRPSQFLAHAAETPSSLTPDAKAAVPFALAHALGPQPVPALAVEPADTAPPGANSEALTEFIKAMRREMQDALAQTPSVPANPVSLTEGRQPRTESGSAASSVSAPNVASPWAPTPPVEKLSLVQPRRDILAAEPTPINDPGRTADGHSGKSKNSEKKTSVLGAPLVFPPLEHPPLPISAVQQQRLQALLYRYQKDEISAAEYHLQRAAVLSEQ